MASVLTTNLQTGGAQFQAALRNSQNAVSSLLRQAGVVMPNGTMASGVGGAFDPANMVGGKTLTPEEIKAMISGTSYGAEGGYSEAYQAGGNIAADQAMQSRSRGLGTGGLAAQRQELALMQTQKGAADITGALLTGIGNEYGTTQQADLNELQRQADANVALGNTQTSSGTVVNPETPKPETSVAPINPLATKGKRVGEVRKNKAGVKYRWSGKNWVLI